MSVLKEPPPARLVFSLFARGDELITRARERLEALFSPVRMVSDLMRFDHTRYYEPEFGPGLVRRFVVLDGLYSQGSLAEVKVSTQALEAELSEAGRRTVNVDPGILTLERLVLATGKDRGHRVYLGRGVFAELTLVWFKGGFEPLSWTYPDWRAPESVRFWEGAREDLKLALKRERRTA